MIESYRILGIEAKKFVSDGFVLVESARAFPGADSPLLMHASGHLQMRNYSKLGSKFTEILYSDIHRPFFNLEG